jgi:hypothetical protein
MLATLPAAVQDAFRTAVTAGVQTAFLWAAVVAVVAVVAAWLIREVPLRSAPAVDAPAVATPADDPAGDLEVVSEPVAAAAGPPAPDRRAAVAAD